MRLLARHEDCPYNLAGFSEEEWEARATEFLNAHHCCTMEFDAFRNIADDEQLPGSRTERLKCAVTEFKLALGMTTLAEERWHHDQTVLARYDKSPLSFARQAAASVRRGVQFLWYRTGGRDLAKAPQYLAKVWDFLTTDKPDHQRPEQVGNPMFQWLADTMTPQVRHAHIHIHSHAIW